MRSAPSNSKPTQGQPHLPRSRNRISGVTWSCWTCRFWRRWLGWSCRLPLTLAALQHDRALFEHLPRDQYNFFTEALDQKGDVIAGSPPPPSEHGENWAGTEYFTTLRLAGSVGSFVGRPIATAHGNNAAIPIGRRIVGPDGNFAGVVVMAVRLAYFHDLLDRLGLGPHDSAAVLRDDGTVLMRLPFDQNNLGDKLDASPPFQAFMQYGTTPMTAVDPTDHFERRFVFRRVGSSSLIVSVGLANDAIYASALDRIWPSAVFFLAGAGAFAFLVRLLSREQARRELADKESLEKSRFLTTLSHELRTPLHGVLGYADQLSNDAGLNPAESRQVTEIANAAKHMRDIVNLVLDFARIEALGPRLHMRPIDVRMLVEECVAIVAPGACARGLETKITFAPSVPVQFVTDSVQLRQILVNLLSNAVKYTLDGTVELRVTGDEQHLMFEVADDGIGIPEGKRHQLFKEYERFGTERTSIEGTGLGLAIAHRLARRMGGSMGHRDNAGGGSVFWLELPVGVADADDTTVAETVEAASVDCLRVLVVDDSDVNREVAQASLRSAGHSVTAARDGSEAVRLAASQDFDVILMDVLMPVMGGLQATRQIRTLDGRRGQVPIVAMTANALDRHAEECRQAGMSEYLAKPFLRAELLAAVARAAARRSKMPSGAAPTTGGNCPEQLATFMGTDAVERLLDCLALRIESLLRQLDDPYCTASSDAIGDLAHEVAGSAGTLGFTALSSAAKDLQQAIGEGPATVGSIADDVRREAAAVLTELRDRRSIEALSIG